MNSCLIFLLLVCSEIWAGSKRLGHDQIHPHCPLKAAKISLNAGPDEKTSSYWRAKAQKTVNEILSRQPNKNVAKNVILFLGDGMSIPTISAARMYQGGEGVQLSFEKFPYTALTKTYAVNNQVSDSANTATAYLGGVKANEGTVGIGPEVTFGDCKGMLDPSIHVYSIAYDFQEKNKKTGFVTTARVTHASPAGVYAHTSNRHWEGDSDMVNSTANSSVCWDIARQLVDGETGKNLNVILGGGRNRLLPVEITDEEGQKGRRLDGINLIEKWLHQTDNSQYVWNREQLLNLSGVDNVLGLFADDHMDYNLDRNTTKDPSLAEMTKVAIEILSRGNNGYFLFVEGAKIDMAHHLNEARTALNETVEFAKAVEAANELTDESDTLIIVTADHAHTMSYSGYPDRGNDILGFAGNGSDGIVYATLNYANGPGYKDHNSQGRYDISKDDISKPHYKYPALVPLHNETHGGDDVAVFARGPWAHLFTGVLEQNVLPHLMSYASCVGNGLNACDDENKKNEP